MCGIAQSGGNGDIIASIKRALAQDLKECTWSRGDVAIALSRRAGHPITVAQIDAYTAESKPGHRFPAELVAIWVAVMGSRRLLDVVCRASGYYAADDAEREMADYGRAILQQEKLSRTIAQMKADLQERI